MDISQQTCGFLLYLGWCSCWRVCAWPRRLEDTEEDLEEVEVEASAEVDTKAVEVLEETKEDIRVEGTVEVQAAVSETVEAKPEHGVSPRVRQGASGKDSE